MACDWLRAGNADGEAEEAKDAPKGLLVDAPVCPNSPAPGLEGAPKAGNSPELEPALTATEAPDCPPPSTPKAPKPADVGAVWLFGSPKPAVPVETSDAVG